MKSLDHSIISLCTKVEVHTAIAEDNQIFFAHVLFFESRHDQPVATTYISFNRYTTTIPAILDLIQVRLSDLFGPSRVSEWRARTHIADGSILLTWYARIQQPPTVPVEIDWGTF